MVSAEVAMKRPATPAYERLWTTAVALAVSLALVFPAITVNTAVKEQYHAAPASERDSWWLPAASKPLPLKIRGLATWYNAKENGAWYTRKTEYGSRVVFYAAAGPKLRAMIEQLAGKDIKWGVTTWTKMAKNKARPKLLITSKLSGKSVMIVVTDWCGCQGRASDDDDTRLVDLAPEVWEALGVDLGLGVMRVTIEVPEE
jgi:hypothetical protein